MVTKFDEDFNIEASYTVSPNLPHRCTCPSRQVPCKHIELTIWAFNKNFIDTFNFYDFDTAQWTLFTPQELVHTETTLKHPPRWRRI